MSRWLRIRSSDVRVSSLRHLSFHQSLEGEWFACRQGEQAPSNCETTDAKSQVIRPDSFEANSPPTELFLSDLHVANLRTSTIQAKRPKADKFINRDSGIHTTSMWYILYSLSSLCLYLLGFRRFSDSKVWCLILLFQTAIRPSEPYVRRMQAMVVVVRRVGVVLLTQRLKCQFMASSPYPDLRTDQSCRFYLSSVSDLLFYLFYYLIRPFVTKSQSSLVLGY
ncbi:hypothetical protein BV898_19112 [Hypsibius exemplaris]|uniref:Uncharacterized protein n=1 Tax=Hypsibius exemplaris TaxID=2072580 RepID=A0A9X6RPF3_HYPEX|nr:hypothetical protein BV898_19112 [Hypsibius exemplaris]